MKSHDNERNLTHWFICKNYSEGVRYSRGVTHPKDISALEYNYNKAFFNESHSEGEKLRYAHNDFLMTLVYVFEDGEILQDFFYKFPELMI